MDDYTSEDLDRVIDALRTNAEALGRVSVNLSKGGGADTSGLSGATAKLIKDFNTQARSMTSSIGQISTSMRTLGGSAEELSAGIKGILRTGFFGAIGGAMFAELIEAGEGLAKTYRHLSDVGETFGGSMLSMSKAAADANLPLDEFSAMITRNSVAAEQLEQTSKTTGTSFSSLQKGVTQNLKSLGMYGMSLSEISDLTGDYSETLRLSNSATYRNKEAMTEQITKFAADISEWSAATGRSRKELEEATNDTLRSISATSLQLNKSQQEALTQANAGLNALDPSKQFANALNDTIAQIQQGGNVANTDFYQKMVKANPAVAAQIGEQFTSMAKKVLNGSVKSSDLDQLANESEKAFKAQKKNLYFQAYNAKNADAADLYSTLNQIDGYLTPGAKAAREAAGKQGMITNQFLQLETNLTALGTSFKSSILKVLGIFDDSGNQASVDAADKKMTEMFATLNSIASTVGTDIGETLKYLFGGDFASDIAPLRATLAPVVTEISDTLKEFGKYLVSAQFGKDLETFRNGFKEAVKDLSAVITKVVHGFEAVDHALAWVFGKFDNNGPFSKGLAAVVTGMLGFAAIFKGPKLLATIAKGIFGTLTQRVDIKAAVVNVNGPGGGLGGGGGGGGGGGAASAAEREAAKEAEEAAAKKGIFGRLGGFIGKNASRAGGFLKSGLGGLLASEVTPTLAGPVGGLVNRGIAAGGSFLGGVKDIGSSLLSRAGGAISSGVSGVKNSFLGRGAASAAEFVVDKGGSLAKAGAALLDKITLSRASAILSKAVGPLIAAGVAAVEARAMIQNALKRKANGEISEAECNTIIGKAIGGCLLGAVGSVGGEAIGVAGGAALGGVGAVVGGAVVGTAGGAAGTAIGSAGGGGLASIYNRLTGASTTPVVPRNPRSVELQKKYDDEFSAEQLLEKKRDAIGANGAQVTPAMHQMQIDLQKQVLEELKKLTAISTQAAKENANLQKKGISIAGRQV